MGFFDDLDRFAQGLLKSLEPEEVLKLKSCKRCYFYQKGYCTQTSPPTKILTEYYAQGCIYFSTEQVTTGTITTTERASASSLIDRIKLIDLITRIALIDEITTIGTIGEITTIRDLTHEPSELIMNPSFEQGFAGWIHTGETEIDPNVGYDGEWGMGGTESCRFEGGKLGAIMQKFPVGIDVSGIIKFYAWMRSTSTGTQLFVSYGYTDGSQAGETISFSVANTWEMKTLSPNVAKTLAFIVVRHTVGYAGTVYLDDFTLVF